MRAYLVLIIIASTVLSLAQLAIGNFSTVILKSDVSAQHSVNNTISQTDLSEATQVQNAFRYWNSRMFTSIGSGNFSNTNPGAGVFKYFSDESAGAGLLRVATGRNTSAIPNRMIGRVQRGGHFSSQKNDFQFLIHKM
jgi:hypothetical protein